MEALFGIIVKWIWLHIILHITLQFWRKRDDSENKTKSINALSLAVPNIHGLVIQDYPAQDCEEKEDTKLLRVGASAPASLFKKGGEKLVWATGRPTGRGDGFEKLLPIYETMHPIYTQSSHSGRSIQKGWLQQSWLVRGVTLAGSMCRVKGVKISR